VEELPTREGAGANFVLVHGGCHASWCWDDVVPLLHGSALTFDLPGRGGDPRPPRELTVTDFVDAVVHEIERADLRDVVLVGHSLAGLTVPAVCARIPERISALVLVAASIAPPGGTILDLLPWPIRLLCRILLRFGDLTPAPPKLLARYMFCNDMTSEQAERTLDRMVPEAVQLVVQPTVRQPAGFPVSWRSTPGTTG
jgi:pimeloyl-ACP methyl ester carboxylesterase